MSRLGLIARNPKTALAGVATLMVAAGGVIGSGAFVADQAASNGNSVEAGTADVVLYGSSGNTIDASQCRNLSDNFVDGNLTSTCAQGGIDGNTTDTATFNITNLSPGQPKLTRCFFVGNNGDIPLGIRLDVDQLGGSQQLAESLNLEVVRDAGAIASNGFTGTVIQRKVLAKGTLAELAAGQPFQADVDPTNATDDNTKRQATEAGAGVRYCVTADLENESTDQTGLDGSTVSFGINALGQSIYGDDLDAGRSGAANQL